MSLADPNVSRRIPVKISVLSLLEQGAGCSEIARELGCTRYYVQRLKRHFTSERDFHERQLSLFQTPTYRSS